MRTIYFILRKEFRQIFRNRSMLPIIFIMPIIQLILLANAATFEMKNIKLYFIDKDKSFASRLLYDKFEASRYFIIAGSSANTEDGINALNNAKADAYIEVPEDFDRDLFRDNDKKLFVGINAIDGSKAGVTSGYVSMIFTDFNMELADKYGSKVAIDVNNAGLPSQVQVNFSDWFNPNLDYKTFMVPGIVALLVTLIGTFLTSMNIAREKEIGTIEQLNVTPIHKYQFIIGKLLPFMVIALFELGFGLSIGYFAYHIPFLGSIPLLFAYGAVYLLVMLGIGLLISTLADSQQQAMFMSWFFMVVFILLSGLFTAIENMPHWVQIITYFDPIRYFIEVLRMVLLKGAKFADVRNHFIITAIFAVVVNTFAVIRYRKVS